MKHCAVLICAILLFLFYNVPCTVATSFDKNQGMIDIPVADILDHLQLKASYVTSYWDSLSEENNEDGAKITFGLFDYIEVGITGHTWEFWDFSSYDEENNFVGNIQARLKEEDRKYPAIAVGIHNISGDDTVYYRGYKNANGNLRPTIGDQSNSLFAVMSKTLMDKDHRYLLRGHFGVGNRHYSFKDEDKRIYPSDAAKEAGEPGFPGNKSAGVFGGVEFDIFFYDFFSKYLMAEIISNLGEKPWDDEQIISTVENQTGYYLTNDEVFAIKNAPHASKMLFSILNKKKSFVRLMLEYDGKDTNLGVEYVHDWFDIGFALADLSGAIKDKHDAEYQGIDNYYWLDAMKFNMGVSLKTFRRAKDVVINDPGRNMEEIVEVVAIMTGKDYNEVRQLLQSSPVTILKNRPYHEAKFLVKHLNELGASASMD